MASPARIARGKIECNACLGGGFETQNALRSSLGRNPVHSRARTRRGGSRCAGSGAFCCSAWEFARDSRQVRGLRAGELAFCYGEYGKPMLASPWDETELKFNLSHSAGLALIGVSLCRKIGVDVEHCSRAVRRMKRIAKRFFAPREYERLCALPQAEQQRAFFQCWTRKEAYLKAVGTGLARASKNGDVDLEDTPANWTLRHLDPGGGYVGAVAIAGKEIDVRCWMCETLVARSLSE